MSMEIEFKWDANVPRAFYKMQHAVKLLGVSVLSVQNFKITDVYLDTPARDFEKQKIAFRVRCANQNWEATFKTRTEIVHGKAVRCEETYALPGVRNLQEALEFLHRKKSWKGLCVENLQPLFVLKNRRKTEQIVFNKTRAEIAYDTCEIFVCGRKVFFKEIEMELKKGLQTTFEKIGKKLQPGLQKARVSKVKTAFALLNLWGKK